MGIRDISFWGKNGHTISISPILISPILIQMPKKRTPHVVQKGGGGNKVREGTGKPEALSPWLNHQLVPSTTTMQPPPSATSSFPHVVVLPHPQSSPRHTGHPGAAAAESLLFLRHGSASTLSQPPPSSLHVRFAPPMAVVPLLHGLLELHRALPHPCNLAHRCSCTVTVPIRSTAATFAITVRGHSRRSPLLPPSLHHAFVCKKEAV
ncbi:hypothetical protein SESBI_09171 [Sesbania bispinosa]|nr:hypothetical protein SESBI_09171 [Sesbania bispinosa]